MDPYVMLAQVLWFLKPEDVDDLVDCAINIVSQRIVTTSPESPSGSS